jgi:uncharacterized membrane protein
VTVDPGGSATFPLVVTTDVPERVDLALTTVPEGWDARIRGGGSTVEAVYTTADEPPEVSIEVSIPADAPPGPHQVVLQATAGATSTELTLDLTVEEVEAGAVTLTTDFPNLRGPASSTFRFDLELENSTNQEVTFSLEAEGPPGWTLEARPTGEEQAATAVVAAGATSRIEVTATPPVAATAGVHNILVTAVGGPQPAAAELAIEVIGSPEMLLQTSDERLNARVTVGGTSDVALIVTNTGDAPLANVTLSGTPPQGWEVEFAPQAIPELAPGGRADVTATLRASETAIAGDYVVSIQATADDLTEPQRLELRTTVETSPIGGFIGLGLLALVAVGLLFVFRRYGRR